MVLAVVSHHVTALCSFVSSGLLCTCTVGLQDIMQKLRAAVAWWHKQLQACRWLGSIEAAVSFDEWRPVKPFIRRCHRLHLFIQPVHIDSHIVPLLVHQYEYNHDEDEQKNDIALFNHIGHLSCRGRPRLTLGVHFFLFIFLGTCVRDMALHLSLLYSSACLYHLYDRFRAVAEIKKPHFIYFHCVILWLQGQSSDVVSNPSSLYVKSLFFFLGLVLCNPLVIWSHVSEYA